MNNQDPEVTPEILSIPCVKLTQHNQNIFLFSMDANTLWNILEINERSSDKDEGYQRALSNSRAEDISNFIIQRGIISPALIVSLNKSSFDEATSTLQIPKIDNAGWVIDGQHRLRGAYLASIVENSPVNLTLPVIAFSDLSEDEQIVQFVTINKEAKGVPTSLYYDLLNRLPHNKTPAEKSKEIATEIARTLTKDIDSVFYERVIFVRSPKKGELSVNNFVRKVSPLLTDNRGTLGTNFTQQNQTKIIENYFTALKIVFPEQFTTRNFRFFGTLGFGAAINSFETVFSLTRTEFGTFTIDDIVKVLGRASDYNFDNWDQYGTGVAAETAIGNDFKAVISARTREIQNNDSILRL